MTNKEVAELLARIDERTKNIEAHMKEDRDTVKAHAVDIDGLKGHRNFLHGVWIAGSLIASWLGFGGHK